MSFTYQEHTDPERIEVLEDGIWVATFTIHCHTVTLHGPTRTFQESFRAGGTTHTVAVTHSTWVRAAPGPVPRSIDQRWLACARAANEEGTPDALAIAMQDLKGAPPVLERDIQIAGDASYGPLLPDGGRDEGADFNDYLGLRWLYPTDTPDNPEPAQYRCLDCSGYMRMVWGYRRHLPGAGYSDTIPLSRRPRSKSTLPRRSFELYAKGTGIILVPDMGAQVMDVGVLDVGDLVFFDASDDDQTRLDHVGMYLGTDTREPTVSYRAARRRTVLPWPTKEEHPSSPGAATTRRRFAPHDDSE